MKTFAYKNGKPYRFAKPYRKKLEKDTKELFEWAEVEIKNETVKYWVDICEKDMVKIALCGLECEKKWSSSPDALARKGEQV